MKQEDKDLLLKDLCARLPYGVKAVLKRTNCHKSTKHKVNEKDIYSFRTGKPLEEDYGQHDYYKVIVTDIKPYLFPLSSMTKEQKAELAMLVVGVVDSFKSFMIEVEFYHKHHIDYIGLIEKGLAIDATGLNIY
jgi:hypothetical protein